MTAAKKAPARKAPRVVVLDPDHFSDTFEAKPQQAVAVGLRLVGERDIDIARAQAARRVSEMFSTSDDETTDETAKDEAYNDALMRWVVARATCKANDISAPYFDCAEDTIGVALTPAAIVKLWDELILLQKGKGSPSPPATDEEVRSLVDQLDRGLLSRLGGSQETEVRKLLAYCHAVLTATDDDG